MTDVPVQSFEVNDCVYVMQSGHTALGIVRTKGEDPNLDPYLVYVHKRREAVAVPAVQLKRWAPISKKLVRITSPMWLASACPIIGDPDWEVQYVGTNAKGRHIVTRLRGTRMNYILDPETPFAPSYEKVPWIPKPGCYGRVQATSEIPAEFHGKAAHVKTVGVANYGFVVEGGAAFVTTFGSLKPWEPQINEKVNVTIRAAYWPDCTYKGYDGNQHHLLLPSNKTMGVDFAKFCPYGSFESKGEAQVIKASENRVEEPPPPTCLWCQKPESDACKTGPCGEYQRVHDERLAAGGIDTEYTRGETRRFVNRCRSEGSIRILSSSVIVARNSPLEQHRVRTSDSAGLRDSLAATPAARKPIYLVPEEKPRAKKPTLDWEAWSTPAWDEPG